MIIQILGPERRNERIRKYLESRGNTVLQTKDIVNAQALQEAGVDWIISSGYAPIVKKPVIDAFKNRIINLHISYLPYGQGIFPNFWKFFEDTPAGVTIHFIDEGIDTGEIVVQKQVEFTDSDTLQTSHARLMEELESLFFLNWDKLASGELIPDVRSKSSVQVRYHNRVESEYFLDLLPDVWDTPVTLVEEMGAVNALAVEFWKKYDSEF